MITHTQEIWRASNTLPGFEISNTGRVRNANTGREVAVHGSGAKSYIKLTDRKGRQKHRNLWRVVYDLFGHNPVRLTVTPVTSNKEEPVNNHTAVANEGAQDTAPSIPEVQWADVVIDTVQPGYQISNLGELVTPSGRVSTGSVYNGKGFSYRTVSMSRIKGCRYSGALQMRLDELVARYFLEERPDPTYDIEYINGDYMDCRAENLRWAPRRRPISNAHTRARRGYIAKKVLGDDPHWRLVQTAKVAPNKYWVSDQGEVRGLQNTTLTRVSYLSGGVGVNVKSSSSGRSTTVPVAILVLEAFVGSRPTSRHRPQYRNGDMADCSVENLYWGVRAAEPAGPTPTPVPAAPASPSDDVEVTILARYSYGGYSVLVNDDEIVEKPEVTLENAGALSKIYSKIAQDQK